MDRRQQIIDTAAVLFADRGFHGVSVHDIGAACGISGPAIYKHFRGKDELLTHTLTGISEHLLAGGRARAGDVSALVTFHVDFALTHPERIVVQEREWAHLDDEGRTAVRRLQVEYIDVWVDALRATRDDLDRPTARAAVQATFGLLNSTPHSARLRAEVMRSLLSRMALAALEA